MSGSENSNFGYGNINPYGGNVNPAFVNKWSSNNKRKFQTNKEVTKKTKIKFTKTTHATRIVYTCYGQPDKQP